MADFFLQQFNTLLKFSSKRAGADHVLGSARQVAHHCFWVCPCLVEVGASGHKKTRRWGG